MKTIQWTRRRLAGVAIAVTSVTVAGLLAVGSAVANGGAAPSALGTTAGSIFGFQQDHRGARGGPGIGSGHAAIVAKALGIDEATLRTEMQSGKTIAQLAEEKKVELATIVNALLEERKADLAQKVTDGKMTQVQADAILGGEKARVELMLNGTMPMGGPRGEMQGEMRGPGGAEMLAVAATALGVDEATLRMDLQSGKSFADVAKAKNVDVAKVIAAIVEERKADIAQHVTDGDLTQVQADRMLADLQARVTEMVNNPIPQHGPGKHGGRGEHGGRGGRGGQGGRGMFGFGPGAAQPTPTPSTTSGQGG